MITSAKELAERLREAGYGPVDQAQRWIDAGTFVLDLDLPDPRPVTAEWTVRCLQRAIECLQRAIEDVKEWADEST